VHLENPSLQRPAIAVGIRTADAVTCNDPGGGETAGREVGATPRRDARSDDALLVEQVRHGDVEAGRRFVHDFYPGIYRHLLYLTGRPDAAEDLTQETFLQAWRSLHTFDDRAPLRPWLHRIAHREFLQALRARRLHTSLDEVAELPEPHAAGQTDAVELREVIRTLPVDEREVVVLHYLEGYNCEEIGQILGVPAGTVKYRLFEARATLRRELGEERPQGRRRDPP
jgi:RNA polymerase sigma-70 factor (ECF subfamily)